MLENLKMAAKSEARVIEAIAKAKIEVAKQEQTEEKSEIARKEAIDLRKKAARLWKRHANICTKEVSSHRKGNGSSDEGQAASNELAQAKANAKQNEALAMLIKAETKSNFRQRNVLFYKAAKLFWEAAATKGLDSPMMDKLQLMAADLLFQIGNATNLSATPNETMEAAQTIEVTAEAVEDQGSEKMLKLWLKVAELRLEEAVRHVRRRKGEDALLAVKQMKRAMEKANEEEIGQSMEKKLLPMAKLYGQQVDLFSKLIDLAANGTEIEEQDVASEIGDMAVAIECMADEISEQNPQEATKLCLKGIELRLKSVRLWSRVFGEIEALKVLARAACMMHGAAGTETNSVKRAVLCELAAALYSAVQQADCLATQAENKITLQENEELVKESMEIALGWAETEIMSSSEKARKQSIEALELRRSMCKLMETNLLRPISRGEPVADWQKALQDALRPKSNSIWVGFIPQMLSSCSLGEKDRILSRKKLQKLYNELVPAK
jgi:hypothetical protein